MPGCETCKSCGKSVDVKDKYCKHCGSYLGCDKVIE